MRSKQAKICSLILATAISSTFAALPYAAKAMTEKNGVIYITNKDVKNGKVVIANKTAKSIVIKKSVKEATIKLKGVKLSGDLNIEKGDYVLKTSRTKIKSLKISGKDTKVKFDKSSDLNKRNFVLKITKNTTGTLDLSELGKKVTTELGKNSDINIKVGNNDKASIVVKKSSATSKLELTGANEGASISKIRLESPVKLTVKVNATTLETTKKADKADIILENKVENIKNEAGSAIVDKDAERMQEEKAKEEKEKAEREKADKEREEKAKEEKAKEDKLKEEKAKAEANIGGGYVGGGSSTPSKPAKKTESITLAKDGDITVDGGKTKVRVTYNPVDATDRNLEWTIKEGVGIARIVYSNANEAEIEALANGKCKIEAKVSGSNIKAEAEIIVSNQNSKALENRIKEYLTYTADKLNKDNYADVLKMSDDLDKDIKAKITANIDKAKWEEYKNKVGTKVTELENKIRLLKEAENAAALLIEAAYNNISTGSKIELATAKSAVETIEENRKKVSEKTFKAKVTDENKYNAIKNEVEDYKKIVTGNNPVIGDTGVASFTALPVSAKYELVKVGSSGNIESKELKAGDNQINLLKQMRNSGVGKYTVRLFKEFAHLQDVEIGKSAEKEVKLLENTLGDISYEYDGNEFKLKSTEPAKVRLKFENGKAFVEWDEVPNATSYDVVGAITTAHANNKLGAYNLKSTADDDANIENEFEYDELEVKNRISENNKGIRTMCAVNLKTTKLGFDKIVPVKGGGITDEFWKNDVNDDVAIELWIIPRNINSLYISNMKNKIQAQGVGDNKFFINGADIGGNLTNFKLKDFYTKFYGEPFPTTP